MSYEIITIEPFDRQLKRLAKRYLSLKDDLKELQRVLKENPKQGEPLGKKCFKIRLAITSKNKGKSGGGRVITNVLVDKEKVYLLSIYDKAEQENISDTAIERLLAFIEEEGEEEQ